MGEINYRGEKWIDFAFWKRMNSAHKVWIDSYKADVEKK